MENGNGTNSIYLLAINVGDYLFIDMAPVQSSSRYMPRGTLSISIFVQRLLLKQNNGHTRIIALTDLNLIFILKKNCSRSS